MHTPFTRMALMALVSLGPIASAARADVVVLANRSQGTVRFTISSGEATALPGTLAPREVRTIVHRLGLEIVFTTGGGRHRCRVGGNEIYCFVGDAATLRLTQIGFRGTWMKPEHEADKDEATGNRPAGPIENGVLTIPVKILVDQTERTVQSVWEKRLRRRLADASDILERHCRVRFKVIAAGTWETDDRRTALSELMREFCDKAAPGKARLAIGFVGPREEQEEDNALGCTPGPLHTHILIREGKPRTEPERLEVLVHELGHFLGACHSPELDSVMRPKLGDGRAVLRSFRISFDPLNTLAMNLVAEELARRPVRRLSELRPGTRQRLLDIFSTVLRAMPEEPAATESIRLLGGKPPVVLSSRELPDEVLKGTRSVVTAITNVAKQEQKRPAAGPNPRRTGDALTEHYCRVAAEECRRLSSEHAATAYLLGLAIALDRAGLLRGLGINGVAWEKIESVAEEGRRLEVLGEPAMFGRPELLRSFVVSAAVVAVVQGQAISPAGLQQELLVLQGSDRFRFDELAASLAGITFATQLDATPALLRKLADSFRVADYVLPPKGLPDSLDRDEFSRQYGSMMDERFLKQQDALRKRLLALPGYKSRSGRKSV